MNNSPWLGRFVMGLSLAVCGTIGAVTTTGLSYVLRVFAWTGLEMTVAMLVSGAVSLLGLLATGRQTTRLLDLAVSRGLEVAAALPIVLACAVAVVTFGWRVSFAVGIVTGTLNGLRCLRMLTLSRPVVPAQKPHRLGLPLHFTRHRRALLASQSELLPQLLGLEAAIEFLGFFGTPWQGGLGSPLGQAITSGNLKGIAIYSFLATGWAILAQLLLRLPARTAVPRTLDPAGSDPASRPR